MEQVTIHDLTDNDAAISFVVSGYNISDGLFIGGENVPVARIC